jgi:hypothetical protein
LRSKVFGAVVPVAGLCIWALFAVLYTVDQSLYNHILSVLGIHPFFYPFFDWEYIGAGAKCWKSGIDVYLGNPCDVLGRPHGYSPLWLRATFIPARPLWTNIIGVTLNIAFISSLFFVLRPVNWRETAIAGLASCSTVVLFALERANVDVLFFLVAVFVGILSGGKLTARLAAYGLLLLSGLLKFYPFAGLVIALRERPRVFLAVGSVSVGAVLAFFFGYRDELAEMSRNIPQGMVDSDLFGAQNLPRGLAAVAQEYAPVVREAFFFKWFQSAVMAGLMIAAGALAFRIFRNREFAQQIAGLSDRDRTFLTLGAVLIAGCFLTGQSVEYRGIYLILVLGGLIVVGRSTASGRLRSWATWTCLIILLLMWEGLFRRALVQQDMIVRGMFWLGRELLWWYLVSVLLAIVAIYATQPANFVGVLRGHLNRVGLL